MTTKLVLVRHGQSLWNQRNVFTGWTDIQLSATGIKEARAAGRLIKAAGIVLDRGYTSVLSRAIKTMWLILEEAEQMYLPITPAWQLNERHYGALQGLNKDQVKAQHGERQFLLWRRSYDTPPPTLPTSSRQQLAADPRYRLTPKKALPLSESLKDTCARVWPYWLKHIAPQAAKEQNIIIAAHGNSLRGLIKHLEKISDRQIVELEIPTGAPLVYELKSQKSGFKIISKQTLS